MPMLLSKTFVVYKDLIRKKLSTVLLKLYFIINYYIALNKTAFLVVIVYFTNKARQLLKVILALREYKESYGSK